MNRASEDLPDPSIPSMARTIFIDTCFPIPGKGLEDSRDQLPPFAMIRKVLAEREQKTTAALLSGPTGLGLIILDLAEH